MSKKIMGLFIALCVALSAFAQVSFAAAKDLNGELKAAQKAIDAGAEGLGLGNNTSMDEFLSAIRTLIPEGSSVKITIDNPANYRPVNATAEKDGQIFANMNLDCEGLKTTHIVMIKIPKLTGDAIEANADIAKLDEDKAAVNARIKSFYVTNDVSNEEFIAELQKAAANGSKVEWTDDFSRRDATDQFHLGLMRGTLRITYNHETTTMLVTKVVGMPEEKTDDNKGTTEPDQPKDDTPVTAPKFNDVADDAYYANAVKWAVEKKITTGTSDTTFSPDDVCIRGQILTFLYRAVGSPKTTVENPFTDVQPTDYYYDAALWAYENGMVEGETFDANTPCTRASTVTYLWIYAGAPDADTSELFDDVSADSDYAEAVAWAVDENVTSGTSETTFSPDTICSRGQIVTFLNRAIAE